MFENLKNKCIRYQNHLIKNKLGVHLWLDIYNKNKNCQYDIIKDNDFNFLVNVSGDVDLSNYDEIRKAISLMCCANQNLNSLNEKQLSMIPFKFGFIDGHFDISHNRFINFDFLPKIITKNFIASHNNIVSIQLPKVQGKIDISHNKIEHINLDDCISERIEMAYNKISNIEVNRHLKYLSCFHNKLQYCNINDCETAYIGYNPLEKVTLPKNCIKYNFEHTPFYHKNFKNEHASMEEIQAFFQEKSILDHLLIEKNNKRIKKL